MYQTTGNAQLRALHTSVDAPAVDIYINGLPAITNLAFGQISNYASVAAGNQRIQLFPAGLGAAGGAVIDTYVDLLGDQSYTLAAIGPLGNIKSALLLDTTPAPSSDMAKARVFHASPDAPAVDVAVKGGPALFRHVSFGEATPFVDLSPSIVSLEVLPSGSDKSILSIPDYSIEGGKLYTFAAMGKIEGMPAFFVMPIVDVVPVRVTM